MGLNTTLDFWAGVFVLHLPYFGILHGFSSLHRTYDRKGRLTQSPLACTQSFILKWMVLHQSYMYCYVTTSCKNYQSLISLSSLCVFIMCTPIALYTILTSGKINSYYEIIILAKISHVLKLLQKISKTWYCTIVSC